MSEFEPFPKIGRLNREVVVTEKIDGTNACVLIPDPTEHVSVDPVAKLDGLWIFAASRTRFITPSDDNFGFARWVRDNAEELVKLGPGRHFGEWWGQGIQRGYGMNRKRFSLFNSKRWAENRPVCCDVVPELWRGNFPDFNQDWILADLRETGSRAAPGFMRPEGIVVFHTALSVMAKVTLERDESPKGVQL
jgi:RNA ligase